jgi:putative oxidoreductase
MCISKYVNKGPTKDILYTIARVIVGFLFMSHGSQALFGWFGGNAVSITSTMGIFKIFEFLVGIAILLGLLTRLAAIGGSIQMVLAFSIAHISRGWHPLTNGGEPAVLFFAIFLILIIYGSGKYSLERAIFKKEIL